MFDEIDMSQVWTQWVFPYLFPFQYPEKRKEIIGQIPSDYATIESPIIFSNSEESFDFVGLYDEFFNGLCFYQIFDSHKSS